MTETFTIEVDGEAVDFEIDELSSLEKIRWAAKAPDELMVAGDDRVRATPELLDFLVNLTTSQTALTEELLEEIPQEGLSTVFESVAAYSFGSEPVTEETDETYDMNFNDDGSVDLEDWR